MPVLLAILYAVSLPSRAAAQAKVDAVVAAAVAQTRREMALAIPITPPEPAGWLNLLMGQLWGPYVEPLMFHDNLQAWQVSDWSHDVKLLTGSSH